MEFFRIFDIKLENMLLAYNIIQQKNNAIAITGSLALKLQGFDLPKFPEDLDIIISNDRMYDMFKALKEYSPRTNHHGGFECEIENTKVGFIGVDPNGPELLFSKTITVAIYIDDYTVKDLIISVSHPQHILQGKLHCCFRSEYHKEDHIRELVYYLSNNIDILCSDKK